eukprot:GFKZ01013979.1.p1 GENE.GFKZ01013979.1~~GFKZ01013979.1.p1  ORF type:complete len:967 (+),score=135.19 GFKZ01013979.1:106-3006(+)
MPPDQPPPPPPKPAASPQHAQPAQPAPPSTQQIQPPQPASSPTQPAPPTKSPAQQPQPPHHRSPNPTPSNPVPTAPAPQTAAPAQPTQPVLPANVPARNTPNLANPPKPQPPVQSVKPNPPARPIQPTSLPTPIQPKPSPVSSTPANPQNAPKPSPTVPPPSSRASPPRLHMVRLITHYLGPTQPRRDSIGATLSAFRTRLETNPKPFDSDRDLLAWQCQEAIRTEFFKIIYPAPPSPGLLHLVTQTELLNTSQDPNTRPFFFPGARVAVPTEAGSRRAGTTLQLRYQNNATEALLHLDGPNGGGFQWVQTQALTPLIQYHRLPQRPLQKQPQIRRTRRSAVARTPRPMSLSKPITKPRSTVSAAKRKVPTAQKPVVLNKPSANAVQRRPAVPRLARSSPQTLSPAQTSPSPQSPNDAHSVSQKPRFLQGEKLVVGHKTPHAFRGASSEPVVKANGSSAAGAASLRQPTLPSKPPVIESPAVPNGPFALPPTYVPQGLLETGPSPRERLTEGRTRAVTFGDGSLRRALGCGDGEGVREVVGRMKKVIGIERLVARRKVKDVEYFVKWCGRGLRDGSWERRESLMIDVPGLVRDFDIRHPDLPKVVWNSNRVRSEAEESLEREQNVKEKGQEKMEVDTEGEAVETEVGLHSGEWNDAMQVDGHQESAKKKSDSDHVITEKSAEASRVYIDDVTGMKIPAYVDTPILELSFSGMVLQIRRPNECSLHNESSSANRDYKKRQARFKQEDILAAEKLFPLSKTEARAALDAGLRNHKTHGRHPIMFPKGIGRVMPSDTGIAFSSKVVESAPPSWERYLMGLGLRPKHFERSLPPFFPSMDAKSSHKLTMATRDLALERAVEHRERARRVVRMAYRHSTVADPPASLFRDGKRQPNECDESYPSESGTKTKMRSPRLQSMDQLGKDKDMLVASTLVGAKKEGNGQWFDPYWSCWRIGAETSTDEQNSIGRV